LRDVWSGGSHCPQSIKDRFATKFGLIAHSTYGATEVPTLVTIVPRELEVDAAASGRPLPHLAVHIRGEDGTERPVGSSGEICIGPTGDADLSSLYHPMHGYWQNQEASVRALRDGELHTGDVGFLDTDGYLHVQDRHQSLILRGGANIYPAEVERVLNEVPGIAASCVVGIPDDRLGARVAAVLELDDPAAGEDSLNTDDLRSHCQANLARYKVPEVFVVSTLHRNAMGKVIVASVQQSLEGLVLPPNIHRPP
jgi:long-chain acyl-CoA synthetase